MARLCETVFLVQECKSLSGHPPVWEDWQPHDDVFSLDLQIITANAHKLNVKGPSNMSVTSGLDAKLVKQPLQTHETQWRRST